MSENPSRKLLIISGFESKIFPTDIHSIAVGKERIVKVKLR